jgi:hypothetical protein
MIRATPSLRDCGTARANTARSGAKVFWFFFSKKNILLPSYVFAP